MSKRNDHADDIRRGSRRPFWRMALHVAIATAVGNVVLAVLFLLEVYGYLPMFFGRLSEVVVYEGVVLVTVLVSAWLAHANRDTTLAVLTAAFAGALAAGLLGLFLQERASQLGLLWGPVLSTLPALPIAGLMFALFTPGASRWRVALVVIVGFLLLGLAMAWAFIMFEGLAWDFLFARVPFMRFLLPLWALVGVPLTVAIVVRMLIGIAEKPSGIDRSSRRRLVRIVGAALAVASIAVLAARAPRCIRFQQLMDAVESEDAAGVRQILQGSVDLNAKNTRDWTPLHCAASKGHGEIAALLIERGANVDAEAERIGVTPLHCAVVGGHRDVVELLLRKGANPNAIESYGGFTSLDWAEHRKHEEIAGLIRRYGGKTGKELRAKSEVKGQEPKGKTAP